MVRLLNAGVAYFPVEIDCFSVHAFFGCKSDKASLLRKLPKTCREAVITWQSSIWGGVNSCWGFGGRQRVES